MTPEGFERTGTRRPFSRRQSGGLPRAFTLFASDFYVKKYKEAKLVICRTRLRSGGIHRRAAKKANNIPAVGRPAAVKNLPYLPEKLPDKLFCFRVRIQHITQRRKVQHLMQSQRNFLRLSSCYQRGDAVP